MIVEVVRSEFDRKRKPWSRGWAFFLPLLVCLLSLPARAADGTWLSGPTGTLNWFDTANWVSGTVPGTLSGSTNPDIATFGSNTGSTFITIDAGRNLRSLLFNGIDPLGLYTIGSAGPNLGETLHLSSGGSITVSPGTQTATTINAPLILEAASPTTNGSYSFTNNATNVANDPNPYKLNLLGDISGGVTEGSITLNFTGTAGNRSADSSANIVSGLISDGDAEGGVTVTVTGSDGGNRGAWTFTNNNNSYTGTTTISAGTLIFSTLTDAGVNSALGAGDTIQLNTGAQAKYTGAATSTNRTILGNGGTLYAIGSGDVTLNGTFTLNGGLTFRGGRNFIIDTVITGTSGIGRTDSGTVFLNQTNTFNGNINISDGAFRFATITNKLVNSPIGAGSTITFGQNSSTVGRIEFTGTSGGSSNRDFVLSNGNGVSSGNGRIDNTVAGQTLTLSGAVRASNGTATFVSSLNLTGVGDGVMSGVIGGTNSSPTTANNMTLTKNGSGTWALSNANIYYGPTNISAGTLLATNVLGSATGTGSVTTSGTGGLGGTGKVTGADGGLITIASGTRLMVGTTHGIAAGLTGPASTTSGVAQLQLGTNANVALTLAGTLQFDLFGASDGLTNGSADRLFLQTTATSITLGGTISVADMSGTHSPWRAGKWQLIDWTGVGAATRSGTFTYSLPANSLASGYSFVTDDFLTTGEISIAKTADNHTWVANPTDNLWATASNWEAGTVPSSGTDVFFGNSSILTHITATTGDRSVRNLFFTGEASHTVNASSGVLYVHGTHLEVLGGSQLFGAMIRPVVGGSFNIANEGTLQFNQAIMFHRFSGSSTLDILFSGSGSTTLHHVQRRTASYDVNLRFEGPGTVTFTGSSSIAATPDPGGTGGTITGTTTISGGKVRMNNELNLGSDPAAFNAAHLTIDGGTLSAYATFAIDDANRGVTLGNSGGTVETEGTSVLTVASTITGPGSLTKTGPGTLILTANNDYQGATNVNGGTLLINGDQSGADGAMIIGNTGTLGGTGIIGGNTTIGSGGTITSGTSTAVASLASNDYLTFNADLTAASGSTWLVNLVQNVDGSADFIDVNGALDISGATLSVLATEDYTFMNEYRIAQYNSLVGTFADLAPNDFFVVGGNQYQINYGDGSAGSFITLTAVPEPGTLLILVPLLALGFWLRLTRRRLSLKAQALIGAAE